MRRFLATNLLRDNGLTVHVSLGKSSDAIVSCPKLGSFPFPPLVVDPENMKAAEVAEATDDGLLLEKWQRSDGGRPLATKRIRQSLSEAGASITVDWNFEIEHAPTKMPTRG